VTFCPECGRESERGACVACPAAELLYGAVELVIFPSPLAVPQLTRRARLALRSMVLIKSKTEGRRSSAAAIERTKCKLIAWSVLRPKPPC